MKKFQLFLVAFALFSMSAMASVFNPIKPNAQLRAEIIDLIGTTCPYEYDKNECTAEVLFTINNDQEIVILSVLSPNERAEPYLKSKMNYKEVSHVPSREGDIFLLPLRMVREQ